MAARVTNFSDLGPTSYRRYSSGPGMPGRWFVVDIGERSDSLDRRRLKPGYFYFGDVTNDDQDDSDESENDDDDVVGYFNEDFGPGSPARRMASVSVLLDVERLSAAVRCALQCPVCMEPARSMENCCQHGHCVCDDCASTICFVNPEEPKCPVCRSPLSGPSGVDRYHWSPEMELLAESNVWFNGTRWPTPRRSPYVTKLHDMMSTINVMCTRSTSGCRFMMPASGSLLHDLVCAHTPGIRCLAIECPWSGPYSALFDHVHATHPFSAYDVTVTNRNF